MFPDDPAAMTVMGNPMDRGCVPLAGPAAAARQLQNASISNAHYAPSCTLESFFLPYVFVRIRNPVQKVREFDVMTRPHVPTGLSRFSLIQ